MADAIPDARALDRSCVRARARERYSAARMAADYEELYRAASLSAHAHCVGVAQT